MDRTPMKNQQTPQPLSNRKSDISTIIEVTPSKEIEQSTLRPSGKKRIFDKNKNASSYLQQIDHTLPVHTQRPLNFCGEGHKQHQKQPIMCACECEGKSQICKIIKKNLLKNINVAQMSKQYNTVSQTRAPNIAYEQIIQKNPYYIYNAFLQSLPSSYSRAEIVHLNNLMLAMGIEDFTTPQFQLLSSIHSHAKKESITYYLYNDLKNYLPSFKAFKDMYKASLRVLGMNEEKVKEFFKGMGQGIDYKYFIQDFYESGGANVVPNCYYAQLLNKIYCHGFKPLLGLLIMLLTQHFQSMVHYFRFIRMCKFNYSRLHMLMLDWNQILQASVLN